MSGYRYRWCLELYSVEGVGNNVIRDGFIPVIGTPHGDNLLIGFVKLDL